MPVEIRRIAAPFFLTMKVNCYLVKTDAGFILIDSGMPRARQTIESAIRAAGCQPGDLKLIALTHGDVDHCGNAAYFRQTFDAPIALHAADRGMVEDGDFFASRSRPNPVMRFIAGNFFSLKAADRFSPDVTLAEGGTLAEYGLDAQVLELPGHCGGNIGFLLGDGTLFCGDLLGNLSKPEVWSLVDDQAAMQASFAKLDHYAIGTVHPGHGAPFPIGELVK